MVYNVKAISKEAFITTWMLTIVHTLMTLQKNSIQIPQKDGKLLSVLAWRSLQSIMPHE